MDCCLSVKLAINRCDKLEGPSLSYVNHYLLGSALSLPHIISELLIPSSRQ